MSCFLGFCALWNGSHRSYANVMANLTSSSESSFKTIIVQSVTWFGTVSCLCKVILLLFLPFPWIKGRCKRQGFCTAHPPPLSTLGLAVGAADSLQWFRGTDPLRALFQGHLFEEITADGEHTIYFSVYFAISTKINRGGEQVVLEQAVKPKEHREAFHCCQPMTSWTPH